MKNNKYRNNDDMDIMMYISIYIVTLIVFILKY